MRAKARAGVLFKPSVKPQAGSLQEAKSIPLSSPRLKPGVSCTASFQVNCQAQAWRSMRAKARVGVFLEPSVKPQAGSPALAVLHLFMSSARLKPGVGRGLKPPFFDTLKSVS